MTTSAARDYPIRIFYENGEWLVDWCRFDGFSFDEPFFHETVARALQRPFNRAFRRVEPLASLAGRDDRAANGARAFDALAPDGFVFHLSRCGSTLVSQAFAALDGCIAISEAGPIDEVLRAHHHDARVDDAWRGARLRELVAIYGRARGGNERRYIVKLDAWHVFDLELIERTFPRVPWVFIAREPIEVMVSHERDPGWIMSAVNAPTLAGLTPADAMRMPKAEYHARVLGRILAAAQAHESERGLIVDYVELPNAIVERIAPHFGLALDDDDRARIARATSRHSKRPHAPFEPDAASKRSGASAEIVAAAEGFAIPAYRRLDERRLERRRLEVPPREATHGETPPPTPRTPREDT